MNIFFQSLEKRLFILIFIFSVFISLVFLFLARNVGPEGHRIPGPDYLSCYAPMAENIIQGKGIPVKEDSYIRCAPGYHIILLPIF